MTDIVIIKGNPLTEFVSKAVELEARELEVEYKDGYEEITVLKGQMGFGIARLKSDGKEATNLRNQLYAISQNKEGKIRLNDGEYRLNVETYQSFGEDVFRLTIKKS
jgi:hypothetical protein